jgi:hypothetical protein
MDWPLLYTVISEAVKIPLVATGVGGLIGASLGSLWTHHFTQRREREKLLREKAEALIFLLYQAQHRLTTWRLAIGRQALQNLSSPVVRPDTLLLDLNQMDALQELYFPVLREQLAAMEDAMRPLIDWLEDQWDRQDRDFPGWRAQFDPEASVRLFETYSIACREAIEAVRRVIPHSRTFTVAARTHKH